MSDFWRGYRALRLFPSRPEDVYPAMIQDIKGPGIQRGEVMPHDFYPDKAEAKDILPRAGWHMGRIPYASQFNVNDASGAKTLMPGNMVWSEVEIPKGYDFTRLVEAMGDPPKPWNYPPPEGYEPMWFMPHKGSYIYSPPNQGLRGDDPWIIGDTIKHTRLISDVEADEILRSAGLGNLAGGMRKAPNTKTLQKRFGVAPDETWRWTDEMLAKHYPNWVKGAAGVAAGASLSGMPNSQAEAAELLNSYMEQPVPEGPPETAKARSQLEHEYRRQTPGYPEYASQTIEQMPSVAELASMSGVPLLSEAGDVAMGAKALEEGNYADALMAGLGLALPFVGGPLIKKGVEALQKRTGPVGDVPLTDPMAAAVSAVPGAQASVVAPLTGKPSMIKDWRWKPEKSVAEEVGLKSMPEHVKPFADFMQAQRQRAAAGEITPRDLIKSYVITRSSIQRTARDLESVPENIRWAGEGGKIRPEDAYAAWLMTPTGKRYLDSAEKGVIDVDAVKEAQKVMKPFGKQGDLKQAMEWAAGNLPGREAAQSKVIADAAPANEWLRQIADYQGIGPSKAGFVGSMLGYGRLPTLDARQLELHTRNPRELSKYGRRGGGEGASQAVMRLAGRQERMNMEMPGQYEPFRQHLTHHSVWDRVANEETTHDAVIQAMKLAGLGGLAFTPVGLSMMSQDERGI